MTTPTDIVLVQQSRSGDKAAFSLLVTRHLPRVRRVLLAALYPIADVDDVLQETFLQAYLSLDRLRDPAKFRAWVCGIGLNLARMQMRALPQGIVSWDRLAQWETAVLDPKPSPEQLAEKRLTLDRLQQAIADLPPGEREALLLVYRDGLTHKETAVQLGASLSAVKVRVHRGRRRLQETLQPDRPAGPERPRRRATEVFMIKVHIHDVLEKQPAIDSRTILQPVLDVVPEERHAELVDEVSFSMSGMMFAHEFMQSLPEADREPVWKKLEPLIPHCVVLLREDDGDRVLPIWIGPIEAYSLVLKMRNAEMKRPITHDLITTLLELGQTRVVETAVSRLHDGIYYGSLYAKLGANGETVEVDCRVSDMINVALRLDVPIKVAPEVMAETAVPASDYAKDDKGHYTLKNPRQAHLTWRSMLTKRGDNE